MIEGQHIFGDSFVRFMRGQAGHGTGRGGLKKWPHEFGNFFAPSGRTIRKFLPMANLLGGVDFEAIDELIRKYVLSCD
jgi:hypothetical protein